MSIRNTAACVAIALSVAAPNLVAQMSKPAASPDPNDRGGEFTITGCLARERGPAAQPMFKITNVKPGQDGVGEGKAVGAMGGGTPITGVTHSSAADKQDPPEIVRGEYRVVTTERTDLAQFAGQQVEARGRLRSAAKGASDPGPTKMSGAATTLDVFEASSVKKLSGGCSDSK